MSMTVNAAVAALEDLTVPVQVMPQVSQPLQCSVEQEAIRVLSLH